MPRRPVDSTTDLSAFARGGKRRDEALINLKRRVQKIAQVDGSPVVLTEGLHLARIASSAIDPERAIAELKEKGSLSRALFTRLFGLDGPPVLVNAAFLAMARREIKALSTQPALASAREHRRALARYGVVDARWLAEKSAKLDAIHAAPRERGPEAWFEGVVELVRARRGEKAARALADAGARIAGAPAERREKARARIVRLITTMPNGTEVLGAIDLALAKKRTSLEHDAEIARLAERLDAARDLPGRARRRRILEILRAAVSWPDAPAEIVEPLAAPMNDIELTRAVATCGLRLADSLPRRERKEAEELLDVVAWLALLLPIDADGVPIPTARQRERLREAKNELVEMAERGASLAQAVALSDLEIERGVRRVISRWVAEGLEIDLVEQGAKDGQLGSAIRVPDVRAARAYLTWASRLAAHYKAMGITFSLSPELFHNLPRDEDLGVLAICLMEHARDPDASRADPIAVLDATLGLFQKLPTKAKEILGRLRNIEAGAGRSAFPEVAAWLGDDDILDRYVHVLRLIGEPVVLTKRLREDYEHAEKSARERKHLESLKSRSSRQESRLTVLRRGDRSLAGAPRGRTRRRIAQRVEALLPIAYRKELDAAFREILREAWGIAVPSLTPAWRDAVRFWLVVDDNRDLLGQLLRRAAEIPGRDPKRWFPKNVAWLEKTRSQLDVDAWMRPWSTTIATKEKRYVIALEEDPLEVLRMGIPFGTCLALETGVNAASTVLNAMDANKRVIYVRANDERGPVVARQLIAISKDLRIVGYNVYVATRGDDEALIRAGVRDLVTKIAAEVGAPLAADGEPIKIHEGFWYDDGTVPFDEDENADVAAYCRSLGLTPPESAPATLAREARGWAAMEAGDVAAVANAFSAWDGSPPNVALGRWLVDRLGPRELERRAHDGDVGAFVALLRWHADAGEEGMIRGLEMATRVPESVSSHRVAPLLARFAPSRRLAAAIVEMGERSAKRTKTSVDHSLAHLTMYELDRCLEDVGSSFDLLDRIDPVFQHVVEHNAGCSDCKEGAAFRLTEAFDTLHTERPDDDAIVACLSNRHRSLLSQRVALELAARHVLAGGERALTRFFALRPLLAETSLALAAMLRQIDGDRLTPALVKKLPAPTTDAFEALRDLSFQYEGMDVLLGTRPRVADLDAWHPTPWELAWFRRKAPPELRRELFAIAARAPCRAPHARALLALLGDVESLRELKERCQAEKERPPDASEGGPADAKEIKSEHHEIALMLSVQVRAHGRQKITRSVPRVRWADAAYADFVFEKLVAGSLEESEREAALQMVVAHGNGIDVWALQRALRVLAKRGDDASALAILEQRVNHGTLRADLFADLWQRPLLHESLVSSLARAAASEWSAHVWSIERAAAARKKNADDLLERTALAILLRGEPSIALDVETEDQLRSIIATIAREAPPEKAVTFYAEMDNAVSAVMFLRAFGRLSVDRAAALREVIPKVSWGGELGSVTKAWLLATRSGRRTTATLQEGGASSIERG